MTAVFGLLRHPRSVLVGDGAVASVPRLVAQHGTSALLCTDPVLAATDQFNALVEALSAAGISAAVFDQGIPDLPLDTVHAAAAAAAAPDVVIGYGGGSSIDLAKMTALMLAHGGPVEQYYGEGNVPGPVRPIIAVPTTAGTGSEATPVAVVTDPDRQLKVGVSSPHLIPTHAVVDPELTVGCPPGVTAHSGIDALAHAIEAYTASRGRFPASSEHFPVFVGKNELSDPLALAAVARIAGNLPAAVADGKDLAARREMALGSLLAGLAFGTAGTTAAHALQYPIGAATGTPHGLGVGILLPHVLAYNAAVRAPELASLAVALGCDADPADGTASARAAVAKVADLARRIDIPAALADIGVDRDELRAMAGQAAQVARLVDNNARRADADGLHRILLAAWHGDFTRLYDDAWSADA